MKTLYMESTKKEPEETLAEIQKELKTRLDIVGVRVDYDGGEISGLSFGLRKESQVLRWIQAQLALLEVGMVEAEEVFLPHLIAGDTGRTLFEVIKSEGFKALPGGAE